MTQFTDVTIDTLIDTGIFIIICLLGVIARFSYDNEVKKKKFVMSTFFSRLFLTILFSYVVEVIILKSDKFREYYTQIMLLFSFFFVDILELTMKNKNKMIIYVLNIFTKGMTDIKDNLKDEDKIE